MPTYEYHCEKCGHEFEKFQAIAEKPLNVCPENLCGMKRWGKGKVKKLISAGAGLLFKGTGFYITDYRSDNYKQAAKKETESSSSRASGETKTSGSKPADSQPAKAETKTTKSAKE